MGVGESRIVDGTLTFGHGSNNFMASNSGDIFVTDRANLSSGQLNQIGVFGDRQNYTVSFSEGNAFVNNDVRVSGSNIERGIYTIPGEYTITRNN